MNSCPDCDKPLRQGATSCGCGWALKRIPQERVTYSQCEWSTDSQLCRYPGSMGGGPWYCRLHYGCKDPIFGAQIVQASMDYQHPTQEEIDAEARRKSTEYCQRIGMTRKDGESEQAYAIRRRNWLKEKFQTAMKVAA